MKKPATQPINVVEAAESYIIRGWQVVPLSQGTKACRDTNWIKLVFKSSDFLPTDNIGIRSTNGLVDIDCDAPEVVQCAGAFLPATGTIYGRKSKPRAHWLYRSVFDKPIAFKDSSTKATLIEIRVNHQSMAPPSVHPDGEPIEWEGLAAEAASVEMADLLHAVRLVATCALIARHYNPPGDRHDWGLALSGTLMRLGVSEEEALTIFQQAGKIGGDKDIKDRLAGVRSTYSHDNDDLVKSTGALKQMMGDVGTPFVKDLLKIWGGGSSDFIIDEKSGKPYRDNVENIRRALTKLDATLHFDAFSQKPVLTWGTYSGPLEDNHLNRLWFTIDERFHFRPGREFFDMCVRDLAWQNQRHPVKEWMRTLEWDGVPRVDTWLITYAKAADTPYVRAVSSLVLIAAVRRIMHPGCKFDELLILEGEQGQNKSSAMRVLCPREEWFSDDLPLNIDAKQIIEMSRGKWIIEASEMAGHNNAAVEHLKRMLSTQVDGPVRMAYAKLPVEQPRQFIVVGTTNSHVYLSDPTGNRRFWPLRIQSFDLSRLASDRDQIWAEAVKREAARESIRLSPHLYKDAAFQQNRRRDADPWEDIIDTAFPRDERQRIFKRDIWGALGISIDRREGKHSQRVNKIMQLLGFRTLTLRDPELNMKEVKGWGREAEVEQPKLIE